MFFENLLWANQRTREDDRSPWRRRRRGRFLRPFLCSPRWCKFILARRTHGKALEHTYDRKLVRGGVLRPCTKRKSALSAREGTSSRSAFRRAETRRRPPSPPFSGSWTDVRTFSNTVKRCAAQTHGHFFNRLGNKRKKIKIGPTVRKRVRSRHRALTAALELCWGENRIVRWIPRVDIAN